MTDICIFEESKVTKEFKPSKGLFVGSCKKLRDAGYKITSSGINSKESLFEAIEIVPDGGLKMLWMRGHGSQSSVSFVDYLLTTEDVPELAKYASKFAPNAYILIEACNAGKGGDSIAAEISALFPEVSVVSNDNYGVSALVVPENDGKLLFRMDGREKSSGRLCRTEAIYVAGKRVPKKSHVYQGIGPELIIEFSDKDYIDPISSLRNMILRSEDIRHVDYTEDVLEFCDPKYMFKNSSSIEEGESTYFYLNQEHPCIWMPPIVWILHLCIIRINKDGAFIFGPCYVINWGAYYGIKEEVKDIVRAYQYSTLCKYRNR